MSKESNEKIVYNILLGDWYYEGIYNVLFGNLDGMH